MYSLRLFITNYILYYNVYRDYFSLFIEKHVFVLTSSCVSVLHGHLCPVWPEAVHCCLQELHCLPNI